MVSTTAIDRALRLPTFVVIGATKAGTTSLYKYLERHEQVFMSPVKELRFFSRDERWRLGPQWYAKQFAGAGEAAVAVGEASPHYTTFPRTRDVPARMASLLPAVRLVYLVRHPVDRAVSHYRHRIASGREHRPVEAALLDPWYVDESRYAMQLDQYLQHFDRSALLVLDAAELRTSRATTMQRVCEHIGVPPVFPEGTLEDEFNVGDRRVRHKQPRSRVTRRLLRESIAFGVSPHWVHRRSFRYEERQAAPAPVVPPELRAQFLEFVADDVERMRDWLGQRVEAWRT